MFNNNIDYRKDNQIYMNIPCNPTPNSIDYDHNIHCFDESPLQMLTSDSYNSHKESKNKKRFRILLE